jgi:hypothetical protein
VGFSFRHCAHFPLCWSGFCLIFRLLLCHTVPFSLLGSLLL